MLKFLFFFFTFFLITSQTFASSIYVWWDIMLSRTVWAMTKLKWTDWVLWNYNPTLDLDKSTVLFFNLESPFSNPDNDVFKRTFSFWSNIKNKKILEDLKGDRLMFLSLANNHILNSWFKWLQLTIDTLEKSNIEYIWVSKNQEVYFKSYIKDWKKYCVNAYTYDWKKYTNWKDIWYVNHLDKAQYDVDKMIESNCNIKTIMLHWGDEYKVLPNKNQIKLQKILEEKWVEIILWWHSHILWKIEQSDKTFTVYSLWNYIFDQNWWDTGCSKGMDCIYSKELKRKIVPTAIGTWLLYDLEKREYELKQFKINNWRLSK